MELSYRDPFNEISIGLNYVIAVFLLELGVIFIKQWIFERKKQVKNEFGLGYGIYFLTFSISSFLYFYIIDHDMSKQVFDSSFILSILIRGIGGLFFAINLEYHVQKVLKTRYLFSISSIILLPIITFSLDTTFFYRVLDIFDIFHLILPIYFTSYFIRNAFGEIRQKLKFSVSGFLLFFITLTFSSKLRIEIIEIIFSFANIIIFLSKLIAILAIFFVLYGFTGYSFYLETQWKNNLISIHIIKRKERVSLYNRNFLSSEIQSEALFAGGITGMVKIVSDFTDSNKTLQEINVEDKLILLEFGKYIITGMIIKKRVLNARYILKEITSKFEFYFREYLENYELFSSSYTQAELFRPMEMVIRNLIKM